MKKILPLLAVCLLVLSGLGAVALSESENEINVEINKSIKFSTPLIQNDGQYTSILFEGTDQTLKVIGKPEMTLFTYSYELPFGSKNIDISYTTSGENEVSIAKKIKPSPQLLINSYELSSQSAEFIEDPAVYLSSERYPSERVDYKISCGINSQKNRVTHISLYFYPIQYSPTEGEIYSVDEIDLTITYEKPTETITFGDENDLVIIAPEKFSTALDPLVQHKNDNNIVTFLKTTEDIYSEYTGVDQPEQIKYFIKDAIETYNIKYVLLVGGLKSYYNANDREDPNQGSTDWYVPVRYTNIEMAGGGDPGCISDLYYADIYDGEGNFSSWNSNDDGYFAHWGKYPGAPVDELDLYPDVFLGRLPCRNTFEVKLVVRKIINYEGTSPDSKSWYDKMIGIAGMSHAMYQGQPDGEYLVDLAIDAMSSVVNDEVRCYSSNEDSSGPLPVPKDITREISKGAGFVLFEGHGHPIRWDTHPVGDTGTWIGGLHLRDMWKLFNLKRLPFIVVGGCHNGEFNITWYNTKNFEENDDAYWTHGDPGSECFNWRLVTIPYGGAIATVGATGLTVSWSGIPESLNSEIEINIFEQIGEQGASTPGEAVAGALTDFIDDNPLENTEAHVITIVHLFGDPSLQFGGFA